MKIFEIELSRPVGGLKREMKFLNRRLEYLYQFFESHTDFYKYYRSGQTDRDPVYFLRNVNTSSAQANPHLIDSNPFFTASHDGLVSEMMANDMLRSYLLKALSSLQENGSGNSSDQISSRLQWTASKTGLVELIYALHSGGVCNNGNADIKFIAGQFEQLFHVELANFYHVFNEIRLRKKSRTQLLDTLKESIIRKMDAMDER